MRVCMQLMKLITPFAQISNGLKLLIFVQAIFFISIWILLPNRILPSPFEIANAWHRLASTQGLLLELINSAQTIWMAILWSSLISFSITCLSTTSLFKPLSKWATAFRFLGFAGVTYLFTLWTDSQSQLKLWLLVFGMTPFLLTNCLAISSSITQEDIDYAKTLGLSDWRIVYEILFRGHLDEFLDLTRQNAAIGWTLLSMVEGITLAEGGIGALLIKQNRQMNLDGIFAIQITILLYGINQDIILKYIREFICPYIRISQVK